MRIFLPRPLSTPLLYHLKFATSIRAPSFQITHIYDTFPYKSIIGTKYTENFAPSNTPLPRFEATHYLESLTQHKINQHELRLYNYIEVNGPHMAHFLLPSSVKPNDRLLLI